MLLRMPYRRSMRWRYIRALIILIGVFITLDLLSLSWTFSRQQQQQRSSALSPTRSLLSSTTERIFISSTHWNNEAILRSHWNSAVLDLVRHVGPAKIYISIYESGSWDDSKGALRQLDVELGKLGVRRTIVLDETTHADEIANPPSQRGWINTPRGKKELRRIPYLSRLRNLTLKPLEELVSEGLVFDKILFLNDVIFTVYAGSPPCFFSYTQHTQAVEERSVLTMYVFLTLRRKTWSDSLLLAMETMPPSVRWISLTRQDSTIPLRCETRTVTKR